MSHMAAILAWSSRTPLGLPVVPLVQINSASASGWTSTGASWTAGSVGKRADLDHGGVELEPVWPMTTFPRVVDLGVVGSPQAVSSTRAPLLDITTQGEVLRAISEGLGLAPTRCFAGSAALPDTGSDEPTGVLEALEALPTSGCPAAQKAALAQTYKAMVGDS